MQTIFLYIIQVNFALVLFYLLYTVLFKRDTFLKIRRFYFLSSIVFSLIYPLFVVPGLSDLWIFRSAEPQAVEASVFFEAPTFEVMVEEPVEPVASVNIPWEQILTTLYIAVTIFFIMRFLWQLISIFRIRIKSEESAVSGVRVYDLNDDITPFSFFGMIFINSKIHSDEELEQIIIHEHTHAREKHSLDIMLVETVLLFSWWNPFVWLFKREMAISLEYLADNGVLREGVDCRDYQYHLLRLTYHETAVQIVNNFNVSPLKKRIMMMNKTKSSSLKLVKYLLIVPLTFLLITFNSCINRDNENETDEAIDETEAAVVESEVINDDSEAFVVVEEMPAFPGGNEGLMKFLADSIRYPVVAQENGIQGRVIVNFVVEKNGSLSDFQIVRGVDPSLDNEALRVLRLMPDWTPGKQKGENVRVRFTLPVVFRLQSGEKKASTNIVPPPPAPPSNSNEVFVVVEDQPEFPGGNEALMKFLSDNVKYPADAQTNGIQGRLITNFVVEKDGSLTDVQVVKGISPSLDKEAIRVIESMPKWKPGVQNGEIVRVRYTLPVVYRLQN